MIQQRLQSKKHRSLVTEYVKSSSLSGEGSCVARRGQASIHIYGLQQHATPIIFLRYSTLLQPRLRACFQSHRPIGHIGVRSSIPSQEADEGWTRNVLRQLYGVTNNMWRGYSMPILPEFVWDPKSPKRCHVACKLSGGWGSHIGYCGGSGRCMIGLDPGGQSGPPRQRIIRHMIASTNSLAITKMEFQDSLFSKSMRRVCSFGFLLSLELAACFYRRG